MLKITIVQVQKTKEPAIHELVLKYAKQLSSSVQLDIIDVKDEETLWKKIPKSSFTIALEVEGKELSSKELSQFIQTKQNQGISHITFLIGPPFGFEQKEAVDMDLSLSKMTFSHQTIRVLLLEQIYRSISILEGKPFAK